ncbi:GMC family oxidoreductase [Myxococcota bacterium]|nr:GMC family oxidoreductase [Myxococcota bacterium]
MKGSITQGAELTADLDLSCDVCVIGSGAGGSVLAAGLCEAGLDVVLLEEGGYHTRRDFDLDERRAYPMLYQDRGTRATADLAITILQGRSVGGSTTVNWTTCFRTPDRILQHWRTVHGIEGLDADTLAPHWDEIEKRLSIHPWPEELANPNNQKLLKGARELGWEAAPLRRNVKGCANSGYCGVGCPVNGKQAMHLTYLPDALVAGLRLYSDVRADRIEVQGDRVVAVHASVLDRTNSRPTGVKVTVRPKVLSLSGGAINSPALLLRSGLDAGGKVGRRTFLHPVVGIGGRYKEPVHPFSGAPQSIGSHQFFDRGPDKVGFFFESAPLQPMLASLTASLLGPEQAQFMSQLPHLGVMIALMVDGLLPQDNGGTVSLRPDGRIRVDYPVRDFLTEAFRSAHVALARLTLAAGALEALSLHHQPARMTGLLAISQLAEKEYGAHQHAIFSAHQMGGCAMGPDPDKSVVGVDHRFHGVPNLFVVDGSVLPTALGVNPSQTVYGLAHRARGLVGGAV